MIGQFLSKIVHVDDLKHEQLNLITAPCGAGKTTFCKDVLGKFGIETTLKDGLFLIDTATGKEQLLADGITYYECDDYVCKKLHDFRVMTYAGFATLCKLAPDKNYWKTEALIVCDELQNPCDWAKWTGDGSSIHADAINLIKDAIKEKTNTVIAISATPNKIIEEFKDIYDVPLYGTPRQYETMQTERYKDLRLVLNKIQPGQKGIVYVERISQIKQAMEMLPGSIKCNAIWSVNNQDHPMTHEQINLRNYIINNRKMPDDIDVLFINKSAETSISINGDIDFMIIHSTDPDTQVQARGRFRSDLKKVYLHDDSGKYELKLHDRWLGIPLDKNGKNNLCDELKLKNHKNGRQLNWTSVKKILIDNGYEVTEKKSGSKRWTIIS